MTGEAKVAKRPAFRARWRALADIERAEIFKNVVQAFAIGVAGVWIASVWLYDNWAAKYLEAPFARLSLQIVQSGELPNGPRYAVVEVTATNVSQRRFFNYANALTIRSVTFTPRQSAAFDMHDLGNFITDREVRPRPWVQESLVERDSGQVIAYSQYMSQGYSLHPGENYISRMTVIVPVGVDVINLSARLTYGASKSLFEPNEKVSGGLAIDKNDDLAACATRLADKRDFQTPCDKNYSDEFTIRSAYAESSYVFKTEEIQP